MKAKERPTGEPSVFGLVTCLLLAAALSAGCGADPFSLAPTDLSSEHDIPLNIDLSEVTYSRDRESIPVKVKVTNPDFVFPFLQRDVGSAYVTGTSTYKLKFGSALKVAAPLVWNKYLDVRVGSDEKLPTIEMEVAKATGSGVLDLGVTPAMSTNNLSLTLSCRLISADGRSIGRFSSVKSASATRVSVFDSAKFWEEVLGLMAQAFDDILEQFFSSDRVTAALAESSKEYQLAHRPARPPVAGPTLRPIRKRFALVIGVATYRHAGQADLTNLIYADDDAKAFAALLKKLGWSDSHVKLLTNKQATQRNILIALESWLTKAGPDDLIVLFWSGHGFPDPEDPEKVYFACYDTDLRIPATGYRMDRVRKTLEERKARNVVVLADTCHAGKLITRGDKKGVSIGPYMAKLQRKKDVPKGWIFMVASDTDRKAVEHSSWSNGAFTHCLLAALAGKADGYQGVGKKDGVVTMLELRTYLSTEMPEQTQKILGVAKRPIITTSTGDTNIWNLDLKGK